MLVEAAQHLDTHPGPLGAFFRKLAKKKNRNVAVVATARKLVTIAWHMLKSNQPYRYALPLSTEEKLRHLRVLATGERRKGGNPKGQGRVVSKLPAGGGSRTIKALPAVYASEGLLALATLPPGESRTLAEQQLTPYAQSLLQTHVIPRRRKTATP